MEHLLCYFHLINNKDIEFLFKYFVITIIEIFYFLSNTLKYSIN